MTSNGLFGRNYMPGVNYSVYDEDSRIHFLHCGTDGIMRDGMGDIYEILSQDSISSPICKHINGGKIK
jgi:hypothetical protein